MFGFGKAAAAKRISPADAVAKTAKGEVTLIDVREASEWAMGHAAGAVHVPLGLVRVKLDPNAPDRPKGLGLDSPIVVYCAAGGRSAQAQALLTSMGYTDVANLGGLGDWQSGGGKVTR